LEPLKIVTATEVAVEQELATHQLESWVLKSGAHYTVTYQWPHSEIC
jgi:hypothetical protein